MLKPLLLAMLINNSILVAQENNYMFSCPIDNSILFYIASMERHTNRDIGYPYLISFNNKSEAMQAKNSIKSSYWLDNRTIDCKSQDKCVDFFEIITNELNIKNLDLGAFQFNFKYFKYQPNVYFSLIQSYKKACNIIYSNIQKYGYNWDTIAMYHSHTKKYKDKYLQGLLKIVERENK